MSIRTDRATPAVTATLALAGASWLVTVRQMRGMDMGGHRPRLVAGALTVAAGLYELTPFRRRCRERCRGNVRSGLRFGLYCVGSSLGLMVMLIALGVMSITWMVVAAAVVLAQKVLPPRASLDVSVALAIVGVGILTATM